MLNAKKVKTPSSGPKAPAIDEGAYPARLVQVIDLGVQKQMYAGEIKPPKNDIWTTYELVDEFMPDEDGKPDETKPRWLSERFALNNLNSDLAKSTKRYYALDPKGQANGNWEELIGKPVLVTVTKKKTETGERNYIGGSSAPRPKDAASYNDLVNDPKIFSMENPDVEVFLSLPDFLQGIIKEGLQFEGSKLDKLLRAHKNGEKIEVEDVEDDSIPFEYDEQSSGQVPGHGIDLEDGEDW